MLGYFPLICKPHFQPPASGGAAARDRRRQRLPPFRGGTGPARGRRKGFDQASGGAADGAREGEAPQAAAKGGTGQGKPADGTGNRRRGGGKAGRARITSGGKGGGRTARADGAASCPGFDQAGRHGAERGKGKGGRQAALKGKGRGLCGAVARLRTREKKSPGASGACKVNGAAGHYAKGGGGGGGAATGLWSIGSNKR
jgi:hypothetical protein